jgi:multiple antibiotic resistance protein
MLEDYTLLTTKLVALWAVLDPIGHLPLFMAATAGLTAVERRQAAILAVTVAFCILASVAFAGQFVLHAMGISLLSFQIAGGLIMFLFAVRMVLGASLSATNGGGEAGETVRSLAIHPLATPIIAGPGAILTVVILTDNQRFAFAGQATTLLALITILLALLAVFVTGGGLARALGPATINAMRRIMGLLMAALSVNMVLSALAHWLHLPEI